MDILSGFISTKQEDLSVSLFLSVSLSHTQMYIAEYNMHTYILGQKATYNRNIVISLNKKDSLNLVMKSLNTSSCSNVL